MLKSTYPKCSQASMLSTYIIDHLPHLFHLPCIVFFHSLNCFILLSIRSTICRSRFATSRSRSSFLRSLFFNHAVIIFKAIPKLTNPRNVCMVVVRGGRSWGSRTDIPELGFGPPIKTFWVAIIIGQGFEDD